MVNTTNASSVSAQREDGEELLAADGLEEVPVEPGEPLARTCRPRARSCRHGEIGDVPRQEHLPRVGDQNPEQRDAAKRVERADSRLRIDGRTAVIFSHLGIVASCPETGDTESSIGLAICFNMNESPT